MSSLCYYLKRLKMTGLCYSIKGLQMISHFSPKLVNRQLENDQSFSALSLDSRDQSPKISVND